MYFEREQNEEMCKRKRKTKETRSGDPTEAFFESLEIRELG